MLRILHDNFMAYEVQKWVVSHDGLKIRRILQDNMGVYPNIEVLSLDEIIGSVKEVAARKRQARLRSINIH
jgi:hypothetical protein